MTREDENAQRAVRRSTLKSLRVKRDSRIRMIRDKAEQDIREINIMYAEDPERLRAKYAADDYARSEHARKRAEKKIEIEKKLIALDRARRRFTVAEEIFTAIVQGVGAILAIIATVVLTYHSVQLPPGTMRVYFIASYACVGGAWIVMYIMSTLHHALTPIGAKEVFNRLTKACAFVALCTGYTAIVLTAINNTTGWVLFGIAWLLAIVGIVLYSVFGSYIENFTLALYLILGWSVVLAFHWLYRSLPDITFRMLIASGICCTVSISFYALRKIKYMHAVGCLIMLAATVLFYVVLFSQI
ncbi:MAG: hypothetical protein IJ191_07170 [Treponema sp.]|nr:hypothetical protein [Treponema sp.]